MKKIAFAGLIAISSLIGGCADPYVHGPFLIGTPPTYEEAMSQRSTLQPTIVVEEQRPVHAMPAASVQRVDRISPAGGRLPSGARSAW